ncbi:hypothetical protein PHYPSEUDO_014558 [Phytophthora pseudosyringae]|uniref:Uncharacterized protein n=1 Tax=Phytophthora pseudosyringae TaxID=221518 RepID=A0A8T1V7I3_9STRA|nr:hypothetical protein PHYPSEUDO_014558 [Phytophthora pseudosyringae]
MLIKALDHPAGVRCKAKRDGSSSPIIIGFPSATKDAISPAKVASPTHMADVHAAWLAAGAKGDAASMRQLWSRFPEWLDFNRHVGRPALDSLSQRQARFCTWDAFHLRTLGASALHTTAWDGNLAILRFLLEAGLNPDAGGESGMTAAMAAILHLNLMTMRCVFRDSEAVRRNTVVDCRQEQDERVQLVLKVIQLLLEFGAQVDVRSKDGKTALHCSTSDDACAVAKCLLDAGANMDAQDKRRRAAGDRVLLSCGADIDLEDKDGISPLTLLLQRGDLNVLQLFLNHHQCVATAKRHGFVASVLLEAVECRAEGVVRYIVENEYASVAVRNDKGETPMHRAIKQRNPPLMELLNDMDPVGDNLTAATIEALETPAHYAARYGTRREVEMLLRCLTSVFSELQGLATANPLNVVDEKGKTSLYVACFDKGVPGFPGEVAGATNTKAQLLLDHGARLFSSEFLASALAHESSSSALKASRLIFPVQVQNCLRAWVVEDGVRIIEPEDEEATHASDIGGLLDALAELGMQWVTSVDRIGPWAPVFPILVCAGYTHDVVPLLVELPLQRRELPALLRQLGKFSRHQLRHTLLLQLHDELWEAIGVSTT